MKCCQVEKRGLTCPWEMRNKFKFIHDRENEEKTRLNLNCILVYDWDNKKQGIFRRSTIGKWLKNRLH